MALFSKLFGRGQTVTKKPLQSSKPATTMESVADAAANRIASVFSVSNFTQQFGSESLEDGWSIGDALAAWYSLGTLALVIPVWQQFKDREVGNRMVDLVRDRLLTQWSMTDATFARMQKILQETEELAVRAFTSCKEGADLLRFFGRYVSLILGAPIPFDNKPDFDYELLGFQHRGKDLAHSTELSGSFINLINEVKKEFAKLTEAKAEATSQSVAAGQVDTSDYGPAMMPPSHEAKMLLGRLTEKDRGGLLELLELLQADLEQGSNNAGVNLHPEARACLWGLSLAKLGDVYGEANSAEKASFFMTAAWNISRYPIFANNAALLAIANGETQRAKGLLEDYLSSYKSALANQMFTLIDPNQSAEELERLARSAELRLAAINAGRSPMDI
jgi:hypothetical protein